MKYRRTVAAISLSAAALVSIAAFEGYRESAYIPLPGDVPTIGFGTTKGVKPGDVTNPTDALKRKLRDLTEFEGSISRCVKVPLYQHEYDAYVSLAYNVGGAAFCRSTLVRKLNAGDYAGACSEILRWDKFKGRKIRGLTRRRKAEYEKCLGR